MNGTHVSPDLGDVVYVANVIRAGEEEDHGVVSPVYQVLQGRVLDPRTEGGFVLFTASVEGREVRLAAAPERCWSSPENAGREAYRVSLADERVRRQDLEEFPTIVHRNAWSPAEAEIAKMRALDNIKTIETARAALLVDLQRKYGIQQEAIEEPAIAPKRHRLGFGLS